MAVNAIPLLDTFFSVYPLVIYKKNQVLLKPDDGIDYIFLLKKGYIREYLISSDGEELTTHIFRPYSYIPLLLALTGKTNRYYFETMTDVEVIMAPVDKAVEFVKKNPEVELAMIRRLGAGLRGLLLRIENLIFDSVEAKTASLLLYFADRFGEGKDSVVLVKLPITHKEIANFIGASRETISRQMEDFKKRGFIDYRGKFLKIMETRKLELIASNLHKGKRTSTLMPKELNI